MPKFQKCKIIDFSFNFSFLVYYSFIQNSMELYSLPLSVFSHNMKIIMSLSVLFPNSILFYNVCNVCILVFFSSQHEVCGGGNMSAIDPYSIFLFLFRSLSLVSLFPPPPAPVALSDLKWVKGKGSFPL